MSRLRLAAGGAILKLAQEPCYHDIITPEQFQLCGLVINVSASLIILKMMRLSVASSLGTFHKFGESFSLVTANLTLPFCPLAFRAG